MTDTAIQVRGLRKAYGDTVAIAGIDLDVPAGEVFALLGPNGAGKTTTVEILEGYRRRDAGEVRVLGVDPQAVSARSALGWRSRIGIVLQGTGELEELTVREVVHHFAGYYPAPDEPEAVISRVGLAGKADARTHTLSGGQRRRLDVALGIVGRPELLFLDEPTTGFDPEARQEFWRLIRDLAATGTTIVLTTHYLQEAEALADRVAVVAGGRVIALGSPEQLRERGSTLATVSWRTTDGLRQERSATPTAVVTALAAHFGGEVPGLSVTRPSLEDVYLDMIGKS